MSLSSRVVFDSRKMNSSLYVSFRLLSILDAGFLNCDVLFFFTLPNCIACGCCVSFELTGERGQILSASPGIPPEKFVRSVRKGITVITMIATSGISNKRVSRNRMAMI